MFLRISSLAAVLLLAACGSSPTVSKQVAEAAPDDRIDCALKGAKVFTRDCAAEQSADGRLLILRHADGGFRRIDVDPDGTLSAADGADEVRGHLRPDKRLELTVGDDRYLLPVKR